MTRVKTGDAREALHQLIGEKAREAAGTNTLVSKDEEKALDPFLGRAAQAIRAEGGKGARISVDALETRAASSAAQAWDKANPPGNGTNSTYLSQKELQAIAQEDPALGALSKLAYLRVSQAAGGADVAAAVRSYFSTFDFATDEETGQRPLHAALPGATLVDARLSFPAQRATLPAGALASYDFYRRAQDDDWASVTIQRAKISGHDVFVVFCGTDGDHAHLEILDKKGAPLLSGRLNGGVFLGWDEVFGRTRFSPSMVALDLPTQTEGLSEPAERAAAGQTPAGWPGSLAVIQGQLHHDGYRLTRLDLPGATGKPEHEVAAAAFEYLWEESLKFRVLGQPESAAPFLLGSLREGTLVVGEFTRPDGKTYQVADWRDIDDGSYTLYFDRTAEGRLKLAIAQYNN